MNPNRSLSLQPLLQALQMNRLDRSRTIARRDQWIKILIIIIILLLLSAPANPALLARATREIQVLCLASLLVGEHVGLGFEGEWVWLIHVVLVLLVELDVGVIDGDADFDVVLGLLALLGTACTV